MNILRIIQESSPTYALAFLLSIVIAITVHEFAHAWTAARLGDDTPVDQGRVTLNPLAHLDPIGSILFLIAGFGWGRPVIYNPANLARRSDELWVALAGPASNLLLGILFSLVGFLQVRAGVEIIATPFLALATAVNVSLAAFNMLPIPPLDGSAIIAFFWPEYRSLAGGQVGLVILLIIIAMPGAWLSRIMDPIITLFTHVVYLFGLLA